MKALIGRGLDAEAAFATLDEALTLGIDVFDTAAGYAAGESERMIGRWLASRSAESTSRVRIATKVAPLSGDAADGTPFDRAFIKRALDASLERLGVEQVSLYLAHVLDDATPIEATVEGFGAVVESGRTAHVGCCNVDANQFVAALDAADRLGVPGFKWAQNEFNLLSPSADRELRAVCRERGLGYTPFSPLAGGVLTGKYRRGEAFPEDTRMALRPEGFAEQMTDAVHDAIDQLRAEAETRGVSCAALALAWVIAHPDCSAPLVGPARTTAHLGHVAEAIGITLSAEDYACMSTWFESAR